MDITTYQMTWEEWQELQQGLANWDSLLTNEQYFELCGTDEYKYYGIDFQTEN